MGGANTKAASPMYGHQYSQEVRDDRSRVLKEGFNPESADYDYKTAEQGGLMPQKGGENKGHMGSVLGVTPEIYATYKQYGLPSGEAYMLLKGAGHPTHQMAIDAEAERGFEIKKFGDRYFSVPKQQPMSSYDAINAGL
jgi:hypothetical protein